MSSSVESKSAASSRKPLFSAKFRELSANGAVSKAKGRLNQLIKRQAGKKVTRNAKDIIHVAKVKFEDAKRVAHNSFLTATESHREAIAAKHRALDEELTRLCHPYADKEAAEVAKARAAMEVDIRDYQRMIQRQRDDVNSSDVTMEDVEALPRLDRTVKRKNSDGEVEECEDEELFERNVRELQSIITEHEMVGMGASVELLMRPSLPLPQ